jgi:hypothetical protein
MHSQKERRALRVLTEHDALVNAWEWKAGIGASTGTDRVGGVVKNAEGKTLAAYDMFVDTRTNSAFIASCHNYSLEHRGLIARALPQALAWCVAERILTLESTCSLSVAGTLDKRKHGCWRSGRGPNRVPLARYYARTWGMRTDALDLDKTAETQDELFMSVSLRILLESARQASDARSARACE